MLILVMKTVVIYFTIIAAMRFMGKRQVGEMSTPEIIIALLISEIAAMPLTESDVPLSHGIAAIGTLVVLEIAISYIDLKFPLFTNITQGKPIIIVKDGKIEEQAMRKTRLTISEFNEELRLKNTRLNDLHMAILERTGQISLIPKDYAMGTTKKDMNLPSNEPPIEFAVIIDGKINRENLKLVKKDTAFLTKALSQKKVKDIKDVLIMCADNNGLTFFQKKAKNQ